MKSTNEEFVFRYTALLTAEATTIEQARQQLAEDHDLPESALQERSEESVMHPGTDESKLKSNEQSSNGVEQMTWEEAQEAVRKFSRGEVRAITPMAGEMVVLYEEGKYGPNGRHSPPNVELITKADSIWDTWTDDGSMSFRSILQKYPVEVLSEESLTQTTSDANAKAYIGIPKNKIRCQNMGANREQNNE